MPLNGNIREQTDAGKPPVAADAEGAVAQRYRQIARRPRDQKHQFGKIVVEERK